MRQRYAEFGIRVALGARPIDLQRQVIEQTLRLAVAGVGIGVLGALAAARITQSLLYQLSASDPFLLTMAGLAVIGIALAAGFLPAYQAMRIEPVRALRSGQI